MRYYTCIVENGEDGSQSLQHVTANHPDEAGIVALNQEAKERGWDRAMEDDQGLFVNFVFEGKRNSLVKYSLSRDSLRTMIDVRKAHKRKP